MFILQKVIKNKNSDGSRLSGYTQIGYEAFGITGKYIVMFFYYSLVIGACCIYILFIGQSLYKVLREYLDFTSTTSSSPIIYFFSNQTNCIAISAIVVLLTILIFRNIEEIPMLSFFGLLSTVVGVFIVIVVGFYETNTSNPNVSTSMIAQKQYMFVNWRTMPLSIGNISFSFAGSVMYPSIEQTMKRKKNWAKVLTFSLFCVGLLYVIFGGFSYYLFGDEVLNPVMDNLNSKFPKTFVDVLMATHIIFASPMLLCSLCNDLEIFLKIKNEDKNEHITKTNLKDNKFLVIKNLVNAKKILCIFLRSVVVFTLCLISIYVPYLDSFMTLVGAFSNCAIAFVIPVVCYIKLFGFKNVKYKMEYFVMLLTLIIGIFGGVLGAYQAISEIHSNLKNSK